MSEAPKGSEPIRRSSDLTLAIPRDALPPISVREVAALELDPENPETQEMMRRAVDDPRDRETLERCPICVRCPCCRGAGAVTPARAGMFIVTDPVDDA